MAKYSSAQVVSGQVPINERGASFLIFGSIALTTPLTTQDVVELIRVPNGYKVLNVTLDSDAFDADENPDFSGQIGDIDNARRYIDCLVGRHGSVISNNVSGGMGHVYERRDGKPGSTIIQWQTTRPAKVWRNGTMRLAAELQIDLSSFE